MPSKKKTHEELVKQINVRTEFADKVYKKMRADRYGLTFCCPLELESINLTNDICNWQDIKILSLSEVYDKTLTKDPNFQFCEIGTYNVQSGMCEDTANATQVGAVTFTYSTPIANGTEVAITNSCEYIFGRDCPIIMDSISGSQNGGGSNPEIIPFGFGANTSPSWWVSYDATQAGPASQQINGVTEISFVNALAKWSSIGVGTEELSYAIPITATVAKTYYVFVSSNSAFGIKLNGVTLIDPVQVYDTNNFTGLRGVINVSQSLPSNNDIIYLPKDCNTQLRDNLGDWEGSGFTRGYLYPVDLTADSCNTLIISGKYYGDVGSFGMLGFSIIDNTRTEIIASTNRTDLTEIASSDNITSYYSNLSATTTWACEAPAILQELSAQCPTCAIQTGEISWACNEGYQLINTSPPTCQLLPVPPCNTETLYFTVVNQNGDVMPNYEVIFDGGTYYTDILGLLTIVIENASINNTHTLSLCDCITTSGGCAEQNIKITVTDPDAVICTKPDPMCNCNAPAFFKESVIVPAVITDPYFVSIAFNDTDYVNGLTPTAVTYIIYWKLSTETVWNELTGLIALFGQVATTISGTQGQTLEYKIKAVCATEESGWSATNSVYLK